MPHVSTSFRTLTAMTLVVVALVVATSTSYGARDDEPFAAQMVPAAELAQANRLRTRGLATTVPGPLDYNPADFVSEGNPLPDYMGDFPGGAEGAMRTVCEAGHLSYDDPIVYPGRKGAAHLHQFFGNLSVNADSTHASLLSSGNSTCDGGPINRTGYWVPAMLKPSTNQVVVPNSIILYYKEEPVNNPQPLPVGLRMIAGHDMATGGDGGSAIRYTCQDTGVTQVGSLPPCTSGSLVAQLHFPHCWDGVNLDSPNHRSHMSGIVYDNNGRGGCPASHPVKIPRITYNVYYSVLPGENASQWRLSSDMPGQANGASFHADWFGAWNKTYSDRWFQGCILGWRNGDPGHPGSDLCDGGWLLPGSPNPFGRNARIPIPAPGTAVP